MAATCDRHDEIVRGLAEVKTEVKLLVTRLEEDRDELPGRLAAAVRPLLPAPAPHPPAAPGASPAPAAAQADPAVAATWSKAAALWVLLLAMVGIAAAERFIPKTAEPAPTPRPAVTAPATP